MRILAGNAKGRVLKSREGKGTRPTDSRAREMLFNIIGERIVDARFLDLYAGTGAIGLEAISRGAQSAIFIEQNTVACRVIRDNVKTLGVDEQAQVWNANVRSSLQKLLENGAYFDIIFADPPFTRENELKELVESLDKSLPLLDNVDGRFAPLLIVQHHRRAEVPLQNVFLQQQRRAGESTLSFFTLNPN